MLKIMTQKPLKLLQIKKKMRNFWNDQKLRNQIDLKKLRALSLYQNHSHLSRHRGLKEVFTINKWKTWTLKKQSNKPLLSHQLHQVWLVWWRHRTLLQLDDESIYESKSKLSGKKNKLKLMSCKGNKSLSRKKDLRKKPSKNRQRRNLARLSCTQLMAEHKVKDQEIHSKKMWMRWAP